jgi:hypothetical protein
MFPNRFAVAKYLYKTRYYTIISVSNRRFMMSRERRFPWRFLRETRSTPAFHFAIDNLPRKAYPIDKNLAHQQRKGVLCETLSRGLES